MIELIDKYFKQLSNRYCFLMMLSWSLLLGVIDYLMGPEISFSVFYTIPIIIAGWYAGKNTGLIIAIVSAAIWLVADIAAGQQYSLALVPLWNTFVRLGFFLIILHLLIIVHDRLILEESLADTDPLTGLSNRRFFQEQLEREYARCRRYPEAFTIAYFDLDNFKYVNDSMSHDVGDELLVTVAAVLSDNIRKPDFAARLGGDEFAVLFPTLKAESTLPVLENLQAELLVAMQVKNWPVTFSIGVVTFSQLMDSSRDMIKLVDDLMYEVKKSGKNNIRHIIWPDEST
ncbi:MAG: GGDEF domain-containing protein [Gammaproteobacteria bacterium]|nr:GGDEF domain-containing protein [Gammaproteobacteria bacterium]